MNLTKVVLLCIILMTRIDLFFLVFNCIIFMALIDLTFFDTEEIINYLKESTKKPFFEQIYIIVNKNFMKEKKC